MIVVKKLKRDADSEMSMTGKLPDIMKKLTKLDSGDRKYVVTGVRCVGTTDGPRWAMSWRLISMS